MTMIALEWACEVSGGRLIQSQAFSWWPSCPSQDMHTFVKKIRCFFVGFFLFAQGLFLFCAKSHTESVQGSMDAWGIEPGPLTSKHLLSPLTIS